MEFYIDDYSKYYEQLKEDESIVEIEADDKGRKFKIEKISLNTTNEILDLKIWFEVYYRQHFEKYMRLIALNVLCDDGLKPEDKLNVLYKEAEIKRKRIQELEKLV